jgi:hypothetical protein
MIASHKAANGLGAVSTAQDGAAVVFKQHFAS